MPKKGYKHTEETKRKLSESHKGQRPWMKGRHPSEETKKKFRERIQSEGTREKISKAMKGRPAPWVNNKWRIGKHLSEETKKKISEANKGKHRSEETLKKIRGKVHSEKSRRNMSEAHKGQIPWLKGKHHSEETKNKMRGHTVSEETRKKIGLGNKGKIISEETRKKISAKEQGIPLEEWAKFICYEPYTEEFTHQFKNLIRKRDNQVCMNCGVHREKLNRALSIHHINYDKKLSIPENCISLCINCHMKTGCNREYWTKLFQDKLSRLYNYKYSNDGTIKLDLKEVE